MADETRVTRFDFLAGRNTVDNELGKISRSSDSLGSKLGSVGKTAAAGIGIVAVAGLAKLGGALVQGAKDAESYALLQAKTAAVIKSTGNAAHISVDGVKSLASELESLAGGDENVIIAGENVLATFTNVRNEVGKGNDIFNQGTRAALDMSSALGQDMQSSVIQLGKALNDPIKGITALSRVGVSFTAQQKEQIKTLVEHGKTLEAQKVILAEVNKEFGGAAAAAGTGFTGAIARAKDAVGDMWRDLGTKLLPQLTQVTNWFTTKGAPALSNFAQQTIPPLIDGAVKLGQAIGPGLQTSFNSLGHSLQSNLPTIITLTEKLSNFLVVIAPIAPQLVLIGGALAIANKIGILGPAIDLAGAAFGRLTGKIKGAGDEANTSKGKFSTLGGILSSGGVWGAAIAVGTTVLGYFVGKHMEATKRVNDMAEALKNSSGAITEEARAMAVNSLEQDGTLKTARELGLSLRDVTNAALGDAAAQKRVTDELTRQRGEMTGTVGAYSSFGKGASTASSELDRFNGKAKQVTGAIRGESQVLQDAKDKTDRYNQAMGKVPPSKSTTITTPGLLAAIGQAQRLKAGIDALHSKSITIGINTVRTTSGSTAPGAGHASGGLIDGAPSRFDNVMLPMATGEFVVNSTDTRKNLPELRSINAGRGGRGFGTADLAGLQRVAPTASPSAGSGAGGGDVHLHFEIGQLIGDAASVDRVIREAVNRAKSRGYGGVLNV